MNGYGYNSYTSGGFRERNTIKAQNTTTKLNTTTDHTRLWSADYFPCGLFRVQILQNTTAAPKIYLDASVDGVSYYQYATIHPDLTTTANTRMTHVSNMPEKIRIRLAHATTSTRVRYRVFVEWCNCEG